MGPSSRQGWTFSMAAFSRLSQGSILGALQGRQMEALKEKGLSDVLRAAKGTWQNIILRRETVFLERAML